MAIHLINEDRSLVGIEKGPLKAWLKNVIKTEGKIAGVINFIFCSDGYLVKINEQFLKRDYLTDVISFDYTKGSTLGGDILISLDRIRENACEMNVSYALELKRVMVHGLLHLIGYKDDNPEWKAGMTGMEDLYLARYQESGKY